MRYNVGDRVTIAGIYAEIAIVGNFGHAYVKALVDTYYMGEPIKKGAIFCVIDHHGEDRNGYKLRFVA